MPVHQVTTLAELKVQAEGTLKLVDRLVAEWREPPGDPDAPDIIEERRRDGVIHLYVVWAAFDGIGHRERSEIIMDAYEQARPDEIVHVTLAMGLLPAEAKRMGLELHG